ncbi:hypothetical protein CSPAE12_05956 [Colletotrichum incanum]|nr:hypothetical protein CSPAE12_05956 [Colletotrichum incanum]
MPPRKHVIVVPLRLQNPLDKTRTVPIPPQLLIPTIQIHLADAISGHRHMLLSLDQDRTRRPVPDHRRRLLLFLGGIKALLHVLVVDGRRPVAAASRVGDRRRHGSSAPGHLPRPHHRPRHPHRPPRQPQILRLGLRSLHEPPNLHP